jgi:hypothetical protein
LVSIALGGAAVLLQGVWRAERSVAAHRERNAAMFRVGELFRSDASSGKVADAAQAPQGAAVERIVLALPAGRTVEYSTEKSQINRIVRQSDVEILRDTFRLAPESTVTWKVDVDDPHRIILLIDSPRGGPSSEMVGRRQFRIDATLDAHAFLQVPAEKQP